MRTTCVCLEQLEHRALLAAGVVDGSYSAAFHDDFLQGDTEPKVAMHVDNKTIHYAGLHGEATIWRENSNGSLDRRFGSNGKILLPEGGVLDMGVGADGRIVTLLRAPRVDQIILRRFNSNGRRDDSFGEDGQATISTGENSFSATSMALQGDGKIVVAGTNFTSGFVYRITAGGSRDNSFGDNGQVVAPRQIGEEVSLSDVAFRAADKRIVAVGTTSVTGQFSKWNVMVFSPKGALEWEGGQPLSQAVEDAGANRVEVDGDGSILVGGFVEFGNGGASEWHTIVARYPAANSTAAVMSADLGRDVMRVMRPGQNGRVVVANGSEVRRLNYNLTSDNSFGGGGRANLGFNVSDAAVGGDGKVVVDGNRVVDARSGDVRFQSARLSGDHSPAVFSKRRLRIAGTGGSDNIVMHRKAQVIGVAINGEGPFLFSASRVKGLVVDSGAGDDRIRLASRSLPGAVLRGGDGDDTLIGARRKDRRSSIESLQ
jgi:uncharacterized delta-60 repeat protein